jgi:hypothetical protein
MGYLLPDYLTLVAPGTFFPHPFLLTETELNREGILLFGFL